MKKYLILMMILLGLMLSGCGEADAESEAKVYTVTFDTAGGSEIASQRVEHGCKVEKPRAPEKDCPCRFLGWYYGSEKWSFIGYVVTEDMTLTAKWEDCFGLSAEEKENLEWMVWGNGYEWSDVRSIRRCESEYPYADCYEVKFKDGTTKKLYIGK